MLVRKTIFGGIGTTLGNIYVQGGAYGIITDGPSQIGGTLQVIGIQTNFAGVQMNSTLDVDGVVTINNHFEIYDGTSEVTFQNGIFRVSLVGGTTLFRLTDLDGGDINNDFKIATTKTLYVDNIYKSNTGLGELLIEDIGFESGILYCDFIAEQTTNNGIRIDLLKIKDNTIDLVSGTEVIFEKKVRIRDPLYLEVTNIREADLSSGIHLEGNVYLQYTWDTTRFLRMLPDGRLAGGEQYRSEFYTDNNPGSPINYYEDLFDSDITYLDIVQATGGGSNTHIYNMELDHFEITNFPRVTTFFFSLDLTPTANGTLTVNFLSTANNVIYTQTHGPGTTKAWFYVQLVWTEFAWFVVDSGTTVAPTA